MREFIIMTDSCCDLTAQMADELGVVVLPLHLLIFNPVLVIPKSFSALMNYANGLFILPLMAALSQFFMTKLTGTTQPAPNSGKQSAEEQAAANAMNSGFMKWFFPLFSVWICATSNSAFSIYWVFTNIYAMVQQIVFAKYFEWQDRKSATAQEVGIR